MEDIAREIIESVCETDEIFEDCDMDLVEEGYLDSLGVLSIIMRIEEVFNIRISPADISKEDINTVNNFMSFINNIASKRDC